MIVRCHIYVWQTLFGTIEEDFREDLVSLVDYYKENGYRDARVISDSISYVNDKNINLNIKVEEGEKYTFGKITFVGNTIYSDQQLSNILGIKEGDTYNGVELRERIANTKNPDADDLTNAYQNFGYMFSTIKICNIERSIKEIVPQSRP